jgi:hypothetical protein
MDDKYKIVDERLNEDFKIKTFSGFQKNDVISALFKSIDQGKIENALYWCSEGIISGYIMKIWEKLLNYSFKIVHINNPRLCIFLYKKNNIIFNQIKRLNIKNKDYLVLRNSQMIRNLLADIIVTIITSEKKLKFDKLIKIKEEDFNIKNKLQANLNILPSHILRFDDPEEFKIIMNEIFFHLKNQLSGYDKAIYWIIWLLEWEKKHKKQKENWKIPKRNIDIKKDKDKCDFIWIIWEIIFEELKCRDNKLLKTIIKVLYSLFIYEYTSGKRTERMFIIYNAIGHLTNKIDYKKDIRLNEVLYIQTQSNINKMYEIMKKNEKKTKINTTKQMDKKETKKLKKKDLNKEKMMDKLNIFNDITL